MSTTTTAPPTRRRTPTAAPASRPAAQHGRPAAAFLAPFLLLYLLFIIGPALYGLVMSFFDTSLVRPGLSGFAGFGNYAEALQHPDFWSSLWHTIWFTILTTPPLIVLAFVFALLADRVGRGRWFFRLAFFAPFILPSAVVALIWIFLYTPGLGLLEVGLAKIGITAPTWLGDPTWAMIAVIIVSVWQVMGYNMVILLAGLQGVPQELLDAASIDGAGRIRRFWHVTIPLLTPTIFFLSIIAVINSFQVFGLIYVMTGGGPGTSTTVYVYQIWKEAFQLRNMGYAAALSWLLFMVILAITWVQWRLAKRWVHYQ